MSGPKHFIGPDGYQLWSLNGHRHRVDGPAVIWPDGSQSWWLGDKRHRVDGPAIISADGNHSWWLNGKYYTDKMSFQRAANLSDEDMTMLLLKYNWQ